MKTILWILAFIFSLPILLHVYNPSMQLGGLGIILGVIGMIVSPAIIFGVLIYEIIKSFRSKK